MEQADIDEDFSVSAAMDAYENDPQARSNINRSIQANASYNSLFNSIKSYWTKQIPLIKNKPEDQMTDEESNMKNTIESKFKNGDSREIENYAMRKIFNGHSKELNYDKDKKSLSIKGYTETNYDKSIKSK